MLDIGLLKRGRGWAWPVNDSSNKTIMQGWESKRAKARYQAERAVCPENLIRVDDVMLSPKLAE